MIRRNDLVDYCDNLLLPQQFQDYCPNGLQVAGQEDIAHIVTGVTASEALIDAAIAAKAQAILVHHGYFWRGEPAEITGIKQRRLKKLLAHDINLMAYHLPLDAHPQLGNNAQLATLMDWSGAGQIKGTGQPAIAWHGSVTKPCSLAELTDTLSARLQRTPLVIKGHDRPVKTIGWCTGAAQGYLAQAIEMGLDAFVSGEISEPTVHLAREAGIHYLAAGHHATERYGVKALGEAIAKALPVTVQFIDIDNPV
ncbi:dinuclear metal center protein, YbgI/SA1388 family [Methylophaga frappieri]|uniref:GTP cyclohydrolase 1 type 2 homolog n=1 Tax=Methylophaga frappieri (strain ATCC BAA-2434 / DSM 25690 / JAM7) TaxID=754477 RepID=I1YKH1_METFJ|nr:Nif3-like dinuclear metal center hexameric protein [Methylophaga frappieri]AFJ03414.1 dinuclear metal center protein, YbgI/SA1388 family [Methylophaga frappieri]